MAGKSKIAARWTAGRHDEKVMVCPNCGGFKLAWEKTTRKGLPKTDVFACGNCGSRYCLARAGATT